MRNKFFVYGAGGHGKVIADIIEKLGFKIAGFIDDDIRLRGSDFYGYRVLRGFEQLSKNYKTQDKIIIAIGDNYKRKKVAMKIEKSNYEIGTSIHPSAIIGKGVKIEVGTVVMANVVVNSDTRVGKYCILNSSCSIDHDCVIGDFVHISPGAILGGNVRIDSGSWIGLGASIKHNITIGSNSVVGIGSVVVKDIGENLVVIGNPARVLKK